MQNTRYPIFNVNVAVCDVKHRENEKEEEEEMVEMMVFVIERRNNVYNIMQQLLRHISRHQHRHSHDDPAEADGRPHHQAALLSSIIYITENKNGR
jgi:hypothetical protein